MSARDRRDRQLPDDVVGHGAVNRLRETPAQQPSADASGLDWEQTEASTQTWTPLHQRASASARASLGARTGTATPPSAASRSAADRSAAIAASQARPRMTTQHGYAPRAAPVADTQEPRSPRREPRTQAAPVEQPERGGARPEREDEHGGWEERFRQQHAAMAEVEARQAAQGSAWEQKLERAAEAKREAEEAAEAAAWEKARLHAAAQQAEHAAKQAARAAQQQEQARREQELAAQRSAEAASREAERLQAAAAELASQQAAHAEWQQEQARVRQQLASRRATHAAWEQAEAKRLGELATKKAALAAWEHEEALKKQELAAQRATHAAWEREQARLQLEMAERQAAELAAPERRRQQELAAQEAEEAAARERARQRAVAAQEAQEAAAWENARQAAVAAQEAEEAAAWERARQAAGAAQEAEEAAVWEHARQQAAAAQQAQEAAAREYARQEALAAQQQAEQVAAWGGREPQRQEPASRAHGAGPTRPRTRSGVVERPVPQRREPTLQQHRFDESSPPARSQPRAASTSLRGAASESAAPALSRPRLKSSEHLRDETPFRAPQRKLGWVLAAIALAVAAVATGVWLARHRTARVEVETQPADASVLIDGRLASGTQSPFAAADLAPGDHLLAVSKPGFVEQRVPFNVEAGASVRLPPVQLQRVAPQETGFSVESNPPGAQIWVDGRPSGASTPARVVPLQPGSHALRLELEGHVSVEQHVFVPEASVAALPRIELVPLPVTEPRKTRRGRRSRSSDADRDSSDDALDDSAPSRRSRGSAPEQGSRERSEVAPARRSRSEPEDEVVQAEPVARKSAGSGETGQLRLNSRPWTQVTIDGRFVGNTPQFDLRLPAGKHSIKLVNEELGVSRTLTITIKPGETVTRVENLSD
jgi:PEGA domain